MNARRLWALAGLVLTAGLAAVFVVAVLHRPGQSTVRLAGGPVATLRTLTPTDPQFGDTVVATVEVFVDPGRVDPRLVRLHASFAPFTVTSSARSVHRKGSLSIVRVVDRLDCLAAACLPKGEAATFGFPDVRVAYPGGTLVADWPALRVHARMQAADVRHPMLRVGAPQAHPSYRLPPGVTGWTLLAVALVGALAGLGLLARAVLPSLAFTRRRGTSLERILRELSNGSANGDVGRRRGALEQLAHELEPLDEPLSFESRVLAWAPHEPEPETISDLVRRAHAVVER